MERMRRLLLSIPLLVASAAWAEEPEPAQTMPPEEAQPPASEVPPEAVPPEKAPPPPAAMPVEPAPAEPKCYFAKTTFNGTLDFYGMWNFNSPPSGLNALRAFDTFNAGGLQLNLAKLTIARAAEPVGFRLDIGFGNVISSPNGLAAVDPSLATNPTHAAWHRNFIQAYLSFRIPVGRGLVIDAGKFVTHMGNEVIESRDNWNYSRGLLFTYAIPFTHTGLRATYGLSDTLNLGLYWLNGWNSFVEEGSKMQTGGLQLNWAPSTQAQLVFNYIGGRISRDSTIRHVFDLIGIYRPTEQLSLALNFDAGYDDAGPGVKFWGTALYGRYQIAPWYASALRFEFFHNPDRFFVGNIGGITALQAVKIWEVTLTLAELAYVFGPANMLWRVEYRHDQADEAIFQTDSGAEKFQDTITVGTIAYF